MQTDDNNPASVEAGNVTPTSFSVGEAAGKLESLISDDGFGDDQDIDQGGGGSQDDEPILSYADDEPDEAAGDVAGEEDPENPDDKADDEPAAPPEETRLDAVVKLPDGTTATVQQLIDGNLKDADYRKKTDEVSKMRTGVQAEYKTVNERAQTLSKLVTFVDKLVESAVPTRPDAALRERDPQTYADQLLAHEEAMEALNSFRGDAKPMLDAASQATADSLIAHRNEQYRLLVEKDPKFADSKHIGKFINASMAALSEAGYSPQEVQNALGNDHRLVPILEGYLNWQRYVKNRATAKQKSAGKPTPIRDRAGRFRDGGNGVSRTERDAFRQKPTTQNAAKLIEKLI